MSDMSNSQLYLKLLHAVEEAQRVGNYDREQAINEEMDELWLEMNTHEREEVDRALGMNFDFEGD